MSEIPKNSEVVSEAARNYTEDSMSDEEFHRLREEKEKWWESIRVLAEEVKETGDKRKEILLYFEYAKDQLKKTLGIDNLTNIEAWHLRRIVEDTLKEHKIDLKLASQGKLSRENVYDVEIEAMARWLFELYGIPFRDIPTIHAVVDETTKESFRFPNREVRNAEKKREQLKAGGHDAWVIPQIPKDFKEYIRRLREKAHNP